MSVQSSQPKYSEQTATGAPSTDSWSLTTCDSTVAVNKKAAPRWSRAVSLVLGVAILGLAFAGVYWYLDRNKIAFRHRENNKSSVLINTEELALHDNPSDCYLAIHGRLFDLTRYVHFRNTACSIAVNLMTLKHIVMLQTIPVDQNTLQIFVVWKRDYDIEHPISLLKTVDDLAVGVLAPTAEPTMIPTATPTLTPSQAPTTSSPTMQPTASPSKAPTAAPVTQSPTQMPSKPPTWAPTKNATSLPLPDTSNSSTTAPASHTTPPMALATNPPVQPPTLPPTTVTPTSQPTTVTPTSQPKLSPTNIPTARPTLLPTTHPTSPPTILPTDPMLCWRVEEVALHSTQEDCWYILYGRVWDFTEYIDKHPGGARRVFEHCGTDATVPYEDEKKHDEALLEKKTPEYEIGTLCS